MQLNYKEGGILSLWLYQITPDVLQKNIRISTRKAISPPKTPLKAAYLRIGSVYLPVRTM